MFHCVSGSEFICSLVEGHLDCFWETFMYTGLSEYKFSISLGQIPQKQDFWISLTWGTANCSPKWWHYFVFLVRMSQSSVVLHLHQHLVLSDTLTIWKEVTPCSFNLHFLQWLMMLSIFSWASFLITCMFSLESVCSNVLFIKNNDCLLGFKNKFYWGIKGCK